MSTTRALPCAICTHTIDRPAASYVHLACGHHLHLGCAASLIVAGRFRCVQCEADVPPEVLRLSVDCGGDAAHAERVAAAMRATRNEEVGALRKARVTVTLPRGAHACARVTSHSPNVLSQ